MRTISIQEIRKGKNKNHLKLIVGLACASWLAMAGCGTTSNDFGPNAWTKQQWAEKVKGVRTSYNVDHDLSAEELTLAPGDERWLDFVYWCVANKVTEHQIEAYGGTGWDGPTGGVIFHWAPGSHWEKHSLASFGSAIGQVVGEQHWRDTQFPEFFEKYGGVYGVNIKDRLAEIDPESSKPWVEFLEYVGGTESPYDRYLFGQVESIDPVNQKIYLSAGQGAGRVYTFERFYHEVSEVLTDAGAYQFFELYDLYGPGFAARGNWARQGLSEAIAHNLSYVDKAGEGAGAEPGVPGPTMYDPHVSAPDIPGDYPMYADVKAGQELYNQQCYPCHGLQGDGKGFLAAGLDVKPRDFRRAIYKFRSTESGELPTLEDIELTIRKGVPGTAMPAWGQFLNRQQIHRLAIYLSIFSEDFTDAIKSDTKPNQIEIAAKPDVPRDVLVAEGTKSYQELQCWKCHGQQGRGDGPSAPTLEDSWGEPIRAADLTYKWNFKNGYSAEDIYRTFVVGLDGTPMPSYEYALVETRQRWALVEFILSLSPTKRPVLRLADFKKGISTRLDQFGVVRASRK